MKNGKLPEIEMIGWTEFHDLSFELAKRIMASGKDIDVIVSISRGGHVISRIMSDFLSLPIFNVSIQSYESFEQKELKITQKLDVDLSGQNILLIDEIVDTGASLKKAVDYLAELGCASVATVAMHSKPHALRHPDFAIAETTKWIVYPYEVRETYLSLLPIYEKHGLSAEDLKEKLIEAGMDKDQMEYVSNLS